MKVPERGGVRVAIEGDEIAVYVDVDKLLAIREIDVPEVEVLRFSKDDAQHEWFRFVKNVRSEWKRFQKRRKAGAKKPKKGARK